MSKVAKTTASPLGFAAAVIEQRHLLRAGRKLTTDAEAQIVAVRQGLGMATLPCFVGNSDALLARCRGTALRKQGTLWPHAGRTRKTKRGSTRSSYPAGPPHTSRFSRDWSLPARGKVSDPFSLRFLDFKEDDTNGGE